MPSRGSSTAAALSVCLSVSSAVSVFFLFPPLSLGKARLFALPRPLVHSNWKIPQQKCTELYFGQFCRLLVSVEIGQQWRTLYMKPPPQACRIFTGTKLAVASAHSVSGRRRPTLFHESSVLEIMSRGLPLLAHPNLFHPAS